MNLSERIEQTLAVCHETLATPGLALAEDFLARRGLAEPARVALLRASARTYRATPELLALRDSLVAECGAAAEAGALERALLVRAALTAIGRLPELPVDDSVKHLFCKEFSCYANPPEAIRSNFSLTRNVFFAMSRIVLLERFPAGASQWEISGFPRSWLLKVAPPYRARTFRFLALQTKGFKPFFVGHLAGTRQKLPFLNEREFQVAFYRSAVAIEKQPAIKAMMAGSWLHSLETHRVSPHLAFLNRANIEAGGIYTDLGPAKPNDGFLAGDPHRAELYRAGEYKPTFGVVMCTRDQAIAWRRAHPELEARAAVR
jgi:hypothetical protein